MLPGLAGHCRHSRRSTQSQRHSSWFCKVLQAQRWQYAIKEPCFLDLSSSPGTTVAAHNHSVMLPDFAGQSRLNSGRMQSQCHPSWFCRAVQAQNWQDAIPVSFLLVLQGSAGTAATCNQWQSTARCNQMLPGSAGQCRHRTGRMQSKYTHLPSQTVQTPRHSLLLCCTPTGQQSTSTWISTLMLWLTA